MKVQQVDDDDDGNDNDVDNQDDNDTDDNNFDDNGNDNNYYDNDDALVVTGHMFERQLKSGIFLKANVFI